MDYLYVVMFVGAAIIGLSVQAIGYAVIEWFSERAWVKDLAEWDRREAEYRRKRDEV